MRTTLPIALALLSTTLAAQELMLLTASNKLLRVDTGLAGAVVSTRLVTGLQAGETLLGIDFRPANLQLYGLGSTSRLYRIDPATGVATAVGAPFATALAGESFGFDFNPTVDRVRITSNQGQNLRAHPDTGALAFVDLPLKYAATDPNAAARPHVVGSAYTNSFAGATATTLFGIDSNLDVLVTQVPPNDGTLNTIGALGVNASAVAGFDIAGFGGSAFAVLTSPGSGVTTSSLFRINLATGAASFVSTIGTFEAITGMSVIPTPGASPYGAATAGCAGAAAISARSIPQVGNAAFALGAVNGPASAPAQLAFAANGLTTPFVVIGIALWIDPAAGFGWVPGTTDGAGALTTALPVPNVPGLAGAKVFFQYTFVDTCSPLGFAASNALAVTIL